LVVQFAYAQTVTVSVYVWSFSLLKPGFITVYRRPAERVDALVRYSNKWTKEDHHINQRINYFRTESWLCSKGGQKWTRGLVFLLWTSFRSTIHFYWASLCIHTPTNVSARRWFVCLATQYVFSSLKLNTLTRYR
jgi:hypothetical protein